MLRALGLAHCLRCWDHGLPSIRFLAVPGQTFKEDYVGVRCPGVRKRMHRESPAPPAVACPTAGSSSHMGL